MQYSRYDTICTTAAVHCVVLNQTMSYSRYVKIHMKMMVRCTPEATLQQFIAWNSKLSLVQAIYLYSEGQSTILQSEVT